MRLVTSTNLLSLLNIGASGGGTDAGTKALDATFPLIEGATESRLVATSSADTFLLQSGRSNQMLRLSSGFLSSDKLVISVDGGAPAAQDTYLVNQQEGTVLLLGSWYGTGFARPMKVTVKFAHGFDDDNNGNLQDVPEVLQQAHTFMAAAAMQLSPASIGKDKAKALGIDASRGFQAMAQQILQSLHRPRAAMAWPDHTKVL